MGFIIGYIPGVSAVVEGIARNIKQYFTSVQCWNNELLVEVAYHGFYDHLSMPI